MQRKEEGQLPKERKQKILKMKLVKPHKLISREVIPEDYKRVKECFQDMFKLLYKDLGDYCKGGYAIAHSQVDDKDPLRFFVTREGEIVINPIIHDHVRHATTKMEGCMTYPDTPPTAVERWHKCKATYKRLKENGVISEIKKDLVGLQAQIFQHETDHMNGIYVHDKR